MKTYEFHYKNMNTPILLNYQYSQRKIEYKDRIDNKISFTIKINTSILLNYEMYKWYYLNYQYPQYYYFC